MTYSTAGSAFAKVKRAFYLLAVLSIACGNPSSLDAAVARAQARVIRACGLDPAPEAVRLVDGYIECGAISGAVGCTRTPSRQVEVSAQAADLEQVLTHEFLHLLGAHHIPDGHGIMGPSLPAAVDRITAEDLAGVGCPRVRVE